MVILAFVLIVTGCSKSPIKVAVIGDYDGANKILVENGYKTLEMSLSNQAVDNMELVPILYNKSVGPDALMKQLEDHEIDIVVGTFFSSNLVSIYKELQDMDYLTFVPTATSDVINEGDDYIYRLISSNSIMSQQFAEYMSTMSCESHLILYDESNQAYTKYLAENYKSELEKYNIASNLEIIDDQFNQSISSLDVSTYDSIIITAPASRAGLTVQSLRESGYDKEIYITGWAANEVFFDFVGDYGEDVTFFVNSYPEKDQFYPAYKEQFQELYKREVSNSSSFCYEIGYFLKHLDNETDLEDKEAVKAFISENPTYEGVFFNIEFDSNGNGESIMSLLKIEGDSFVHIEK